MPKDCPTQAGTACCVPIFVLHFIWTSAIGDVGYVRRKLTSPVCDILSHAGELTLSHSRLILQQWRKWNPELLEPTQPQMSVNLLWEWLASLKDKRAQAEIYTRIERVELGNFGDCKRGISGRVGELRIDVGQGYRVYFGEMKNIIVILLCGGDKRTQKRDIKKAEKYWQDAKSNPSSYYEH